MTRPYMYPNNWLIYAKEIEKLFLNTNPDYQKQVYIKPIFVIGGFSENPEKYPAMADLTVSMQKKYVSLFLKKQGRIKRGSGRNTKTWMLPETINSNKEE